MAEVTLSTRNRIDVPLEAREALGVRAGDALLLLVKGDHVILMAKPGSWTKALGGLEKLAYPDDYLENERASWD
jgi:AbrB family looped-hinge helix DNA binding protein